ncbi:glycosyltransferase [Luteolibacter sp. LG18]|uniref:glycosyltransferase n=1 Tax=Luteolibacter sp. LG18 TaxID=2819286 RepID=UPI002B29F3FA|nr:hypothetical protein llg_23700 [Luteolibacter sp. LG18]
MIKIVLSSDQRGLPYNATLIGSVLRRTTANVHVRFYTRGYRRESFTSGRLKVDFIETDEAVTGRYPGHVNLAVFDRLRVIRDFDDWDRCLILDHDMAVLCDLAPYFAEDFEGNLLMGRLFGPGNTLGLQMKSRGGLPEDWQHCEDHPYFYMGPMMNLAAMREAGTWEKLLAAHEAIGQDEQLSLTAATDGRVKGVDKKYNLVPQWDGLESVAARAAKSGSEVYVENGITWRNGVPEGIIHWTGFGKPWHYKTRVWRADLWEAEKTSWEHLRMGLWDKPVSVEVGATNGHAMRALARRGWKVKAVGPKFDLAADRYHVPYGDLELVEAPEEAAPALLGTLGDGVDMFRFGPDSQPSGWLAGDTIRPKHCVLSGPMEAGEVAKLRDFGYRAEFRIARREWPQGGPHPKVLEYALAPEALAVGEEEELYLSRDLEAALPLERWGRPATLVETEAPELAEDLVAFLESDWISRLAAPSFIFCAGSPAVTVRLAGRFPGARIAAVSDSARIATRYNGHPQIEPVHAPVSPGVPWYDPTKLDLEPIDLVVAGDGARLRDGCQSLGPWLKPGAIVLLDRISFTEEKDPLEHWRSGGWSEIARGESFVAFQQQPSGPRVVPGWDVSAPTRAMADLAERFYLIATPEQAASTVSSTAMLWPGVPCETILQETPADAEIRWQEMKGMEAHGSPGNLRTGYVPTAVGEKRAGIRALEAFLASGADTALICLSRCQWREDADAILERASLELPEDWDLLYLTASPRARHQPWSPHLVRLRGARQCTAILWTRRAAERLLPELAAADCEWDVFMERSHAAVNAYCVIPMPASLDR